jgi:hypothetical protein
VRRNHWQMGFSVEFTYVETDPTELANEEIRKSWLLSWLPNQAPTDGVTEFYKVLVTMDATNPSRIAYGVDAPGSPAPPFNTLSYTFRIYYALNGEASSSTPAYFDFPQSATSAVIEAHWSSIPYFVGDSYGPQTSNQWVDQPTFNWVADSTRRGLLEPMFDFSMEHGRNTGHTHAHLNGRQGDMYHPGYTALLGSYAGTSGTAFRDNYLLPTYYAASGWVDKDAKGNVISTVAPDPIAVGQLASWIKAARSRIQGFMNVDGVGSFGVMNFIYLSTTTSTSNPASPVVECKELKDLMIDAQCLGMVLSYADGSTREYPPLNLISNVLLPVGQNLQPWSINKTLWIGDPTTTHTNHLHVQWGSKSSSLIAAQ